MVEVPDGELEVTVTEDGLKLVFGGQAFADAEDVAVGMAEVHFADVPGFVGGRHGDIETGEDAGLVDSVNVFDPDGHPDAFVLRIVVLAGKSSSVGTFAAAALRSETEKDFAFAGADGAKGGRSAPVPTFFPAPFFKPGERSGKIGDIENGSERFDVHGGRIGERNNEVKEEEVRKSRLQGTGGEFHIG
jgi:hypothetical protein